MLSIGSIIWDPDPIAFTLPFVNHPVRWYGIFFALGFFLCYLILIRIFKTYIMETSPEIPSQLSSTPARLSQDLIDRLAWYIVLGTIIGARLGHVFFYEWPIYKEHPLDILKIWEGGLASHGGVIGIIIASYLFYRTVTKILPNCTYLTFLDLFAVPIPLACSFIRLGNFFNQEIFGPPTILPWAITFGHPYGGVAPIPRHPTQLYEALAYLAIFVLFAALWAYKRKQLRIGTFTGLALALAFTFRFLLEFIKTTQHQAFTDSSILMGQYLSIPFILIGIAILLFRPKKTLFSSKEALIPNPINKFTN